MATCRQCGSALDEGETTCRHCGTSVAAAAPASAEPAEDGADHAPVGTWSEDTGEVDVTAARAEARGELAPSKESPAGDEGRILRFADTQQAAPERPDAPPLRPERIVRDPDLTPVPGLALALASQRKPRADESESTGTRPMVKDRPMGQVVPLRRDLRVAEVRPEETADTAAKSDEIAVEPSAAHGTDAAEGTSEQRAAPADAGGTGRHAAVSRSDAGMRDSSVSRSESGAARPKPPVLASESLREDLTPTEPGRQTIRIAAVVIGVVAGATILAVGDGSMFVWLAAALLFGCAALGLVPIRYEARAVALTALGVSGLVVAVVATGVEAVPPVLATAGIVLGAGLMFRGTYRASMVARVLAGIGIGLGLIWFIGSGTIGGLSLMDTTWQSVAGAIVRLVFLILLLLSLLAFMDASTTAAGKTSGTAVLTWYAAFVLLALAVRAWPAAGAITDGPDSLVGRLLGPNVSGPPHPLVTAMTVAGAAFVALTGQALSHVLVALSGGTFARRSRGERADESEPGADASASQRPT